MWVERCEWVSDLLACWYLNCHINTRCLKRGSGYAIIIVTIIFRIRTLTHTNTHYKCKLAGCFHRIFGFLLQVQKNLMATEDAFHSVRLMYHFENNHQTKKQSNSAVKSVIKYGNFQRIIKNIRKIERSGTKMPRKGANWLYEFSRVIIPWKFCWFFG